MYKECSKCNINKNIINFHKLKNGFLGRNSICKECRSNLRTSKNININISVKTCIKCNIEKHSNFFYKNKNNNDGLQSYCKDCHKIKISESNSKLKRFSKIILEKFNKKNKNLKIKIDENDIVKKYNEQKGICSITKHKITHIFDVKQRTDNIWNMSIYVKEGCKEVKYEDFKLVIHLIYTIKGMYNLSDRDTIRIYNEMTM